jgi:hypothetical protein
MFKLLSNLTDRRYMPCGFAGVAGYHGGPEE